MGSIIKPKEEAPRAMVVEVDSWPGQEAYLIRFNRPETRQRLLDFLISEACVKGMVDHPNIPYDRIDHYFYPAKEGVRVTYWIDDDSLEDPVDVAFVRPADPFGSAEIEQLRALFRGELE